MSTNKLSVLALFMTILVDAAGMALVYPILTPLFVHNSTFLFDPAVSVDARNFIYGLILAIYPIMMFFGSPFLGTLSDKYGRRSILIICLAGNLAGLLLMGKGVAANSMFMIFLSRIISGITAASMPIAQAAIIDISTEKTKAKNLSLITCANSVGFVVGPLITAVLSKPLFGYTPTLSSPFYITSLLPLVTLLLLVFFFKETSIPNRDLKLHFTSAFYSIYQGFTDRGTRLVLTILTGFLVGYYIFFNYLSIYALLSFGYDQFMESMLLGYFCVIFGCSFLFFIPKVTAKYSLNSCLLLSVAPQCVSVFGLIILTGSLSLWAIAAVMAIFVPCTYVVLLSILSNRTEKAFQGRIIGVSSSVNSFAWGVALLLTGLLQPYSRLLPFVVSTVILALTFMLVRKFVKEPTSTLHIDDISS